MTNPERVRIDQKIVPPPTNSVEYPKLNGQSGEVLRTLEEANRIMVRLNPSQDWPNGLVVNFRKEDVSPINEPSSK